MRLSPAVTRPLLTTLILLTTAVMLFVTVQRPPGWALDVGAPGDGAFVTNFYRAEQSGGDSYRWSGPGAQLHLPALYAGPAVLALRLHSLGQKPQLLHILHAGQPPIALITTAAWRTQRVLLPTGVLGGAWVAAVTLALDSPMQQPNPRDPRELGVALDRLTLAPLGEQPPAAALARTLALVAVLVLLAVCAHWVVASRWCYVLVASAAAALLGWARYDLASLLAATPALWLVALGTAALAGRFVWVTRAHQPEPNTVKARLRLRFAHVCALVLLAQLALVQPFAVDLRGAVAWLILLLPGALLAGLLFCAERDPLLRAFLALCGGLALATLLMLALHVLPGALPGWLVLGCCDAISLWVGYLLRASNDRRPTTNTPVTRSPVHPFSRSPVQLVIVLLLLGAGLRLPWLGGAEFHDDEAAVLLMATGVANGQDDILMLHRKGPVEILLPAAPLVLTGQINEFSARLPFALASVGALLGVFVLARALFVPPAAGSQPHDAAGLLAALVLALDGFLIAYARTVQYQSIIVLMTLGALWCAWRFYAGAAGRRYLVGAAVFAAVALLAHWDGVFALPALAWLVAAGGARRGWRALAWVRGLAWPLIVGAALTGSFYVPFVLHPHFQQTTSYLRWRVGRQGSVFNNLPDYYALATFYNTRFQIIALALTLALALGVWLVRCVRPRALGICLVALLLTGSAALASGWAVAGAGVAVVALCFALPLAALALAPATPAALRVLILWLAPPFLAEGFLVASPRTHFYTMDTAAALLVALALAQLWAKIRAAQPQAKGFVMAHISSYVLPLTLGLTVTLSVPYLYLAFLRQQPEYQRTFPANRPALYRAGYGDARPDETFLFGFPHRDGWKVIAELYRRGVLHGDYNTNQKPEIAGWYTRNVPQCEREPANYIVAWGAAQLGVPAKYQRAGDVYVDGVRALSIFQRAAPPQPPQRYDLDDYRAAFDAQRLAPFPTAPLLGELTPQHALDARWPGGAWLRGYDDFENLRLAPGATTTLLLYWQPTQPLGALDLALDLVDARGRPVASAAPYCGTSAPADWPADTLTLARYTITPAAQTQPGTYTLRVALRRNGQALRLANGADALAFARLSVGR